MTKIWQKINTSFSKGIEDYTVGDDYIYDKNLIIYDIKASIAHAKGLKKAKIISAQNADDIILKLKNLEEEVKAGQFKIKKEDEDCHTAIENYLVKNLGKKGSNVHLGRSRNDQVLVALRMYEIESLVEIKQKTIRLAKQVLELAKKNKNVPMPGYSHTRQAMLSSVSHYFAWILESLLDDCDLLEATMKHLNKCPLGSAAGFGSNFALKRGCVAKECGFDSLIVNSLYAQNSKGKFESLYLESLTQLMITIDRAANDLIYFSMPEFGFFEFADNITTGSSIMPQKKNMDALELIRAKSAQLISRKQEVQLNSKNLLSGYNRDGQLIKKAVIDSTQIIFETLEVFMEILEKMTVDRKSIENKINLDIIAADVAGELVKEKNIGFREAYNLAVASLPKKVDWKKEINKKKSLGSAGNLGLKILEKRLKR